MKTGSIKHRVEMAGQPWQVEIIRGDRSAFLMLYQDYEPTDMEIRLAARGLAPDNFIVRESL